MATALLSFNCELVDSRLSRSLWFLGSLFTVYADAHDTNGQLSLIEVTAKPGGEPPLHVHDNEDEHFTVFEGCLRVTRGNEQLVVEAGQSIFLPRHVPHTFQVLSPQARWLVAITPGGFEDYFRRLGKPALRLAPETNPGPPDVKRMVEQAAEFGITFLV